MGRTLIFLADLHLRPEEPRRAELLFSFLEDRRAEAEAVYILGDLLDFWVGAKQLRRPEWARFLEELGRIADGGPAIRVLGGNRDYLLDEASLAPYGLECLGRQHRLERDGLRLTLVHGDRYFPDSPPSRLFLWWINSRPMCALARAVPLAVSLGVARAMRRWRCRVARNWAPEAGPRYDAARFLPLFDAGADVVICGHNHWAKDYTPELGRPGCRLFALGEWADAPSYLDYAEGQFRLVDPRLPAH